MSKDKKIKVERPDSGICFMISPSDVEQYRKRGYKIHEPIKKAKAKVEKAEPKDPNQGDPKDSQSAE